MTTTTPSDTFRAHVNQAVAAVLEWQRGGCNWVECLRRCDVTAKGNEILRTIPSGAGEDQIRRICTAAVGAGN